MQESGLEGYTYRYDRSQFIGQKVKEYPYNSLLALWATFSDDPTNKLQGTAFLIAPQYVLTSAHNIFSKKYELAHSIELRDPQSPEDSIDVCDFRVDEDFKKNIKSLKHRSQFDFAILKLRKPIFLNKYMHFTAVQNTNNLKGQMAEVFGFPSCEINHLNFKAKTHIDEIEQIEENLVKYKTDTGQGQSGSPVALKIGDSYNLIGIHIAFQQTNNHRCNIGVYLDVYKLKIIEQWMNQMNSPKIEVYTLMNQTLVPSTLDEVLKKTNSINKVKNIDKKMQESPKRSIEEEKPQKEEIKNLSLTLKKSPTSEYSTNSNQKSKNQQNEAPQNQKPGFMINSNTKAISCFDIPTNYFYFNWQINDHQQKNMKIYAGRLLRKNNSESQPIAYIISHEHIQMNKKAVIKVNILNIIGIICVGLITETTKSLIQTDLQIQQNIGKCSLLTYEVSADVFQFGRIYKQLNMAIDTEQKLYVDRGEFIGIEVDPMERKIHLYQNETKTRVHLNIDAIPIGQKVYFYVALGENGDSVDVNSY